MDLIDKYNETRTSGIIIKNYNCWYYYEQEDSRLWWDKPYSEALLIKRQLANNLIKKLLSVHYMKRDNNRIHRILKAITDIDKMLKDDPKLSTFELWLIRMRSLFQR
jgi:hypothetical protein